MKTIQAKITLAMNCLIVVGVIGVFYSHYLTGLVLQGTGTIVCSGNSFFDCGKTLGSSYGKVFGIPVSFFATLYFGWTIYHLLSNSIFRSQGSAFAEKLRRDRREQLPADRELSSCQLSRKDCRRLFGLPYRVSLLAAGVCLVMAGISFFVLRAACLYCLGLDGLVVLTLGLSYYGIRISHKNAQEPQKGKARSFLVNLVPLRGLDFVFRTYQRARRDLMVYGLHWYQRNWRRHSALVMLILFSAEMIVPSHLLWAMRSDSSLRSTTVAEANTSPLGKNQLHIVKFTDFECPACQYGAVQLEKLKEKYPGQVEVEVVNFPLSNKYNPSISSDLHPLAGLAAKVGIVMKQAESSEVAQILAGDVEKGIALDIRTTPTLIVNGERITDGVDVAKLESMILGAEAIQTVVDNAVKSVGVASLLPSSKSMMTLASAGTTATDASAAATVSWVPPIGIPEPSFGIKETHFMYQLQVGETCATHPNKCYDFGSGLVPYPDAGAGPYTHYVDINHPSATNTNNNYGSPTLPRRSIPSVLPAGSIVEIHGGPYGDVLKPYATYQVTITASGTAEKPVFIRGPNPDNKALQHSPNKRMQFRLSGTYLVVENLDLKDGVINLLPLGHHISIRNNEIHDAPVSSGNMITITGQHIVIYKNHIHDNGDKFIDRDPLIVGVNVTTDGNYVWVVDNHMHGNGDSFHAGHGGYNIHHVFVGRNVLHHDIENAFDVKTANYFVLSQNKMYGYRPSPGSGGQAVRINDESWDGQSQVWILFNEIYDSTSGVDPYHAIAHPNIIGNIIYDCQNAAIEVSGPQAVINNTIHDVGSGVGSEWTVPSTVVNNIISNSRGYNISKSSNAHNNILWNSAGPSLVGTTCVNCITANPLLANVPEFSTRLDFYQYGRTGTTLTQVGGTNTVINVSGADLSGMGVRQNDRIYVTQVPEITYATDNTDGCQIGGSTRPQCDWLRIKSISGNNITLVKNIARPEVSVVNGVQINIWHYPHSNRTNEIYLTSDSRFQAGDVIEYNYDGVARRITKIDRNIESDSLGVSKDRITFTPAVSGEIRPEASISNWRNNTNVVRDFRLTAASPGINGGVADQFYQTYADIFGVDIRKDINGISRPQNSLWDMGACEYVSSTTVVDADGDGLLDAWEVSYFGSISDPRAQPGLDPDGDGFTNLSEQTAGTSPIDSKSGLRIISQNFSTNNFNIQWTAVPDKIYKVDYSSTLTNWVSAVTITNSSATTLQWTDNGSLTGGMPSGSVKRFYRVKVP
jgi:thiol-disulfide isomerase/thioredoxin/uncharacterized membrane protein